MAEPKSPVSEQDRKAIVREVVAQRQRSSLMSQLGEIVGNVDPVEAKKAKKLAADAVKAAKKHDLEGPFITEAEREQIYRQYTNELHRTLVEQEFRAEAGEEGIDLDRLKGIISGLEKFDYLKA